MTLDHAVKVIESGIERGLHIGAQLYVSQGGKRVADLAFGLAREGVAMTPDTIMLWMSSTKPITALAIAQMWERGKISLDDRIAKYIPEFGIRGKEPSADAYRRFSIRGRSLDPRFLGADHRTDQRIPT